MVVEVPGDQRDVDVARLANRLAVVHGLQHGKEAVALLYVAGDRVEIFRPLVARQLRPVLKRPRRSRDGAVDILGRAIGDAREQSCRQQDL